MNAVEHTLSQARRHRRRTLRIRAAIGAAVILAVALGGALVHFAGGASRLEVAVAPAEAAAVATIEIAEGRGIVIGTGVWALPGPLALRIGAGGFVPETLAVTRAARTRGRVDVILRERPATLRAATEPDPAQRLFDAGFEEAEFQGGQRSENAPATRWFLDGAFVAEGPRLEIEIPAGEHTVDARHPWYVPASRRLNAERGGVHSLTLPLAPVEGRITITSEPDGARVTHNGQAAGMSPLTLAAGGGVHTLRIAHEGYEARTDTIDVTHDAPEAERHYRLARARGRVSFSLSPEGGTLSIDGRAATATENLSLSAGLPHRVRYAKPGHVPRETEFTLNPGEHRTIALALTPIFGVVEVRSEPEAQVEVGGRNLGRTPQRLTLEAVPQTIRLTRDGYRAETRTVTPDPGAARTIAVTLRTEAQARLDTAPPQYTNRAGIMLKLFRNPGAVILGTPRGEPGRRANEFVREVRLTRAFYAGVHEVTVGQFRRFSHPGEPPVADRRPVTGIGWEEAARYCNWLSRQEGLDPVYRFANGRHTGSSAADGYRLPTEAEWEWLARKAGRGRETRFPWGDDTRVPARSGNLADESARGRVPVYISRYDDGAAGLAEVGGFTANAAGLHDLAGNVREWTHDGYDLHPPPPDLVETDPMDVRPDRRHTVKGSSWRSGTLSELRAAWRDGGSAPRDDLGFRIARYVVGGRR